MRFLMITIHAPMMAHGDTSAGRWRRSWTRPGKSAVLGMVGAALGIDRDETDQHRALSNGIGFAVRSDALGGSMTDFHTFSAGKGAAAKKSRTRRYELSGEVNTKMTNREYRTESLHTIALWTRESAPVTLEQIAAALQRPHWTLFVGRKSCPLALPLNPEIIDAETLPEAFAQRPALPPRIAEAMSIRLDDHPEIATDTDAPGIDARRSETRRDTYHHHLTFTNRVEHILEAPTCSI